MTGLVDDAQHERRASPSPEHVGKRAAQPDVAAVTPLDDERLTRLTMLVGSRRVEHLGGKGRVPHTVAGPMPCGCTLYYIRLQAAHLVDLVEQLLRGRAGSVHPHLFGQIVQSSLHAGELRGCFRRALDRVGDQARPHLDRLVGLGQAVQRDVGVKPPDDLLGAAQRSECLSVG